MSGIGLAFYFLRYEIGFAIAFCLFFECVFQVSSLGMKRNSYYKIKLLVYKMSFTQVGIGRKTKVDPFQFLFWLSAHLLHIHWLSMQYDFKTFQNPISLRAFISHRSWSNKKALSTHSYYKHKNFCLFINCWSVR